MTKIAAPRITSATAKASPTGGISKKNGFASRASIAAAKNTKQ
ncbi:hypothetical protein [Winogradskyella forsetii]|nr:hypothetical protein [Winogradskyella forsetii]